MKDAGSMAEFKKEAALRAAALVESGQKVGLGTGSTAAFAIEELGRRVREEGLKIACYATSFSAAVLAQEAGLTVLPTDTVEEIDISIDGADEIDPRLNLIKGGGAAHTREKIVHALSRRFVVVADVSKLVDRLGSGFAVPLEVLPQALGLVHKRLLALGAAAVDVRMAVKKDGPVISDQGNLILDARFAVEDPRALETDLNSIPGVVENGIFSPLSVNVTGAYIGGPDGVDYIEKQ